MLFFLSVNGVVLLQINRTEQNTWIAFKVVERLQEDHKSYHQIWCKITHSFTVLLG